MERVDLQEGRAISTDLSIQELLSRQKQQRRLQFWAGFLAITMVGGLWAWLIREPVVPLFDEFNDGAEFPAEPDFAEFEEFEEFETTVGFQDFTTTAVPSTQPPLTPTTTAPSTQPPLTPTTREVAPETSAP